LISAIRNYRINQAVFPHSRIVWSASKGRRHSLPIDMAPIIQAGASMKTSAGKTARCHRKVFLLNILLGISVTAIALYMVMTGEYSNLAERKDVEGKIGDTKIAK